MILQETVAMEMPSLVRDDKIKMDPIKFWDKSLHGISSKFTKSW